MKEYTGTVTHTKKDDETGGVSFHLRTATGEEIWVISKGDHPAVVRDGARVIVSGDYSAPAGELDMKRFIARHIEPEHEEDADRGN